MTQDGKLPVCNRFTQAWGEERMAIRGEGMLLHACIIVHSSIHIGCTIHPSVFSFTVFSASTVLLLLLLLILCRAASSAALSHTGGF